MTAQFLTLEIGSLVIPSFAMLRLRANYDDLSARTDRRTAAGGLNRRTAWDGKLRATLSADGWAPLGLNTLDVDSSYTVKLPLQRAVDGATASIDIPAGRRSGGLYEPVGFAIVDGELVSTTISIATNTATLGAVTGASGYRVDYFPQITGYLTLNRATLDAEGRSHGWELVIDEA